MKYLHRIFSCLMISTIAITANAKSVAHSSKNKEVAHCVSVRQQWTNAALSASDSSFTKAENLRAEYQKAGCFKLCGRMVEDTDTSQK